MPRTMCRSHCLQVVAQPPQKKAHNKLGRVSSCSDLDALQASYIFGQIVTPTVVSKEASKLESRKIAHAKRMLKDVKSREPKTSAKAQADLKAASKRLEMAAKKIADKNELLKKKKAIKKNVSKSKERDPEDLSESGSESGSSKSDSGSSSEELGSS